MNHTNDSYSSMFNKMNERKNVILFYTIVSELLDEIQTLARGFPITKPFTFLHHIYCMLYVLCVISAKVEFIFAKTKS